MNLTEIRERAIAYRDLLQDPKKLREQRKAATPILPPEKVIRGSRRYPEDRAHEFLDRIDAIGCLKAIRDEAWHEGKIVEGYGSSLLGGLTTEWVVRLQSDPFYPIQIITQRNREDRVEKILLQQKTALLEIAVRLQTGRVPKIVVGDAEIYYLKSNAAAFNFLENVKKDGPSLSLLNVRMEYPQGRHKGMNWSDNFNPERPFAQDELCLRLDDSLRVREENHNFPSQIRQWCDEVVKLLPPSLKERGEMTAEELREWGYEIRETPRWLRFFDRRLGFLG